VLHSLYTSAKPHSLELLRYYGIPVYDSLDIACKCIGMLAHYGNFLKSYHSKAHFEMNWGAKAKPDANRIIETARSEGRRFLLEPEAKKLLRLHGAPVSRAQMAQNADEAVRMAESVGGAVVLKVVSPQILHKSDAGGVRIGLHGQEQVRRAYDEILANARRFDPEADVRGVLVSPMAPSGVEVIIGTKYDDQFGPVIMYGLGGIMVEILKDVSFRVLPLSPPFARKMMEETMSFPILNGVRGTPPSDKKAIQKLLLLCSEVVESYPEIAEMDLNPVIVHNTGLSVVDARIILKE
ncbi:MAG: acetate--CoA ligase family protein, partial [Desulfobacterales bacterium]|nr:acetate--CoA ligase family protein [Desulfobacterales bacterium]